MKLVKYENEVELLFTEDEEQLITDLKKQYRQALEDINKKAIKLQNEVNDLVAMNVENETLIRSKVYQLEFQQNLSKQIKGYLDALYSQNIKTVEDYLYVMYEKGYITQNYLMYQQGVKIILPLNQKQLLKALSFDFNDIPLSKRLYDNIERARKTVLAEITRGIASGASTQENANNIKNALVVSNRRAYMIAQNEGHRIRQEAVIDAMHEAKLKGADIVKKWVATLDTKTRPVHAELDQQIAEIDDMFLCSQGEVFAPKMFGVPSLDINCRCSLTAVSRNNVESGYRMDNESKQVVQAKNYADWYENIYLKGV